jgi:hypothetical protein
MQPRQRFVFALVYPVGSEGVWLDAWAAGHLVRVLD